MSEKDTFEGGCHCQAVRFRVSGLNLDKTITCNCSRCSKLGSVLSFLPTESFDLLSGEDKLSDYQFNKKVIHHLFCSICGVQSFSRGVGPGGQPMVGINVRCLDDVDVEDLNSGKFDGKSL